MSLLAIKQFNTTFLLKNYSSFLYDIVQWFLYIYVCISQFWQQNFKSSCIRLKPETTLPEKCFIAKLNLPNLYFSQPNLTMFFDYIEGPWRYAHGVPLRAPQNSQSDKEDSLCWTLFLTFQSSPWISSWWNPNISKVPTNTINMSTAISNQTELLFVNSIQQRLNRKMCLCITLTTHCSG